MANKRIKKFIVSFEKLADTSTSKEIIEGLVNCFEKAKRAGVLSDTNERRGVIYKTESPEHKLRTAMENASANTLTHDDTLLLATVLEEKYVEQAGKRPNFSIRQKVIDSKPL